MDFFAVQRTWQTRATVANFSIWSVVRGRSWTLTSLGFTQDRRFYLFPSCCDQDKLNSLQCRGERQHTTCDPRFICCCGCKSPPSHSTHSSLCKKKCILISSLRDTNNVSWWVTLSLQPVGVFLEKAGLSAERGFPPGASAASRRTKVFFQGIFTLQVSWATKEAISVEQTVISHHSNADLTDGFFFFGSVAKKSASLFPSVLPTLIWIFTLVSKFNMNFSFLHRWSSLGQQRNPSSTPVELPKARCSLDGSPHVSM